MESTTDRFANRCLPLRFANQGGWLLLNPATVYLTWNGGPGTSAVEIEYDGEPPTTCALSHFGHGIVTFNLPYLFRTSPGGNLLARGPSSCPIDGLYALEGLVETDWTAATFTVNWQLTRPGLRAVFPEGEPLCMVLPQRRGELESVRAALRTLAGNPQLAGQADRWAQSRLKFLRDLPVSGSAAARRMWKKDYFHGQHDGVSATTAHQTRLPLADVSDERMIR
jgi:hypothetical protein